MKQNYCKIALINGYIRAGNVLSWHKADRTRKKITLLAPTSKKQRMLHSAR
jgi:hypothetical protein